jgi:hypothetical protein
MTDQLFSSQKATRWQPSFRDASVGLVKATSSPFLLAPFVVRASQGLVSIGLFANLSPADKIRWLYHHAKLRLAFLIVGLVAGFYMIIMSVVNVLPYLAGDLIAHSFAASDDRVSIETFPTFQWYIGGLLGIMLVSGLLVWIFATEKKSDQGYEIARNVGGFVLGFLAGKIPGK